MSMGGFWLIFDKSTIHNMKAFERQYVKSWRLKGNEREKKKEKR